MGAETRWRNSRLMSPAVRSPPISIVSPLPLPPAIHPHAYKVGSRLERLQHAFVPIDVWDTHRNSGKWRQQGLLVLSSRGGNRTHEE